jgi:hypothetical protein
VALHIDMIVEADLAQTPLGQTIGLGRQGLEPWGVDLLEQLATGAADVTQDALIVEPDQQLSDGGVHFGQGKRRWRSRPSSHRSTMRTAASTLALSRGCRGRAGSTAVS